MLFSFLSGQTPRVAMIALRPGSQPYPKHLDGVLTDSAFEKSSRLYRQFPTHRRNRSKNLLSRQIESDLVAGTGLGGLSRLFVLLRVLLQNTLAEPVEELFLLRAKLPASSAWNNSM